MGDETLRPLAGLADELHRRHRRLIHEMRQIGADCLVAIRDESITYLTGYTTMTWKMHSRPIVAVLTTSGQLVVIAAETEADSARIRIPGAEVRAYAGMRPPDAGTSLPDGPLQFAPRALDLLVDVLAGVGSGAVAVDGLAAAWPPVGQLVQLVPGTAGRLVDASSIVWAARLQKSEWELDRMRRAAAVLEAAHSALRDEIKPGMTEREIARRFIVAQWAAGATEVGPLGVVAGPERGLFGWPTDKEWRADELLYVDASAIVDGYWSDFCRTYAARSVRAEERAGQERALAGLRAAISTGAVGQTAGTLGAAIGAAMDIDPATVGFGRFGHGIGLHVPELPSLHAADPTVLQVGMTICIEPAVVHEGVNYVVEEEHVLTADGFARISPAAPDGIIEL